ncbi:MAG: MFS transporter [Rhodococcus sp. (in: high G+C Gram-positive bacteria)]
MPEHNTAAPTRAQLAGRPSVRRHGVGFWIVAVAFVTAMAFSTLPSPLYPLYQQKNGFTTFTVTLIFAVYAVGVVISLVLAGHVSDWLGRKKILVPALALELLAAVLFLTSTSLPVLLIARLVTGLGIGILTATATAYLHELDARHRPGATSHRFDTISTVANIGGLGIGPLISGVLAQWVDAPLRTPYVLFSVLLIGVIVAVVFVPETTILPSARTSYRPQRISASHGDRSSYIVAATTGFASFAVIGLFTSVAPGFVAGTLNHPSRALSGLILFLVFGAAAVSGTATSRLSAPSKMRFGLASMAAGMITLVTGTLATNLVVFLLGGILAGIGAGVLFKFAVATVAATASPDARSEALAGLFFLSYLGLSLPALGIGIATQFVALSTAITWLVVTILTMLVGVGWSTRGKQ